MKIACAGIDLVEGKVKYDSKIMRDLVEKANPKKISPYYVTFTSDDFDQADIIVTAKDALLDIVISDIEKCESRIQRTETEFEKKLMRKCIDNLEKETPLCDVEFTDEESEALHAFGPISLKPVLVIEEVPEINELIKKAFEKAGIIFFYTAGPSEVHAWLVKKGTDIVHCAGKIHSDLERGFIKGDVVSFHDFISAHNFNDCRKKGLVKIVDRSHIVENGDVVEIRFNV